MDKVNPFLHIFLVGKSFVVGTEKLVEVELAKLATFGYLTYLVGQLIGHHYHLWQRKIRIRALAVVPIILGALLVRIGPVVYLFLYKLSAGDCTERSA